MLPGALDAQPRNAWQNGTEYDKHLTLSVSDNPELTDFKVRSDTLCPWLTAAFAADTWRVHRSWLYDLLVLKLDLIGK